MSTSLEKIKNSKVLSVIEERTSMLYSQDQRSLSNVGRLGRIGIVKNSRVLPFLR